MQIKAFCLCLLVLLGAAAGPALAQHNLVANPRFNTDLSEWANTYARPAQWRARDADQSDVSGSALLANEVVSNGASRNVLEQCIRVEPNTEYSWGAEFRVPAGQPEGTSGDSLLIAFDGPECGLEGGSILGVAQGASVESWTLGTWSATTGPQTQSVRITLGVSKPDGVAETASANFDNVFLVKGPVPEGFGVEPASSTVWFNPDEPGHGVMVHLINATQAWMCWFNFDLDGERSWVCGLGSIDGAQLTFNNAYYVEGGRFPPLFDPELIEELPWGSITIVFSGCDNGIMTWNSTEPGYQSGSMPLARIVSRWGSECFNFSRLGPGQVSQ